MLNLDPDHRITTIEALAHPYLAQYSDPEDEPTADKFDQSPEEKDLDIQAWKSGLFSEILIDTDWYISIKLNLLRRNIWTR